MFVELDNRMLTAALAISFASVAFRLSQRGVAKRCHDVMRANASIGEHPAERLAQPMRLTVER